MDWSVNESLYSRFMTWKLKCENILEVELASLPNEESAGQFLDGKAQHRPGFNCPASWYQCKYQKSMTILQVNVIIRKHKLINI